MHNGELDGQMIGLELGEIRPARSVEPQGAFRPLVASSAAPRRLAELPDVPTGRELTGDPGALALIEFAELPFFMALPFMAPPGVPPERAKALQAAFMAMSRDETFVEEAKARPRRQPDRRRRDPETAARSAATPKDVIARYNAIGGERK